MIDLHYHATGLGEIDCDCCGTVLGYGFVDYADDCGFLCAPCKRKLTHLEEPEIELQHFEMICRNLDYMFCDGHDWKDITYCTIVFGVRVYECKKCGANKTEPMHIDPIMWKEVKIEKLVGFIPLKDEINYKPWTKD